MIKNAIFTHNADEIVSFPDNVRALNFQPPKIVAHLPHAF